ncbi:RNA polymerase sigma factor (sigma-70 family) [Streptomyces sp. BK208]|uniref:sigma-70 family RNA polymerase sigma factor n=1 Tax=Streptomyces sp. BK208 TaxID=2512150 RepID=UPI0010605606|nr:sigma-70 family RNA polymerase sigma factor [Streptomyces sp. BK208]TDT40034.1 RNA polymerase sigma factor (sigma-70 family) [Streptomyces sp. BK208]
MTADAPGTREIRVRELRGALGALLADLHGRAHAGRVGEDDFRAATASLDLDADGLKRLEAALAQQGLVVEHAAAPSHAGIRVGRVLGLARKYVSAGVVPVPAFTGLVSLCGLDAAERELLTAALGDEGVVIGAIPSPRPADVSEAAAASAEEPGPEELGASGEVPTDLDGAMAAARARMDEDRFARSAWKRLLTAEEEVGLSVLLKGGPEHLDHVPQETELAALPAGDIRRRAYETLVAHNVRLVHKLAQRLQGQGLDHEDLVQHGVLGVMHAACMFDPSKGFKFSTYATWWARQALERSLGNESRLIRIPVHMHEKVRKVAVAEARLSAQGKSVSAGAVAVAANLTVEEVDAVRRISRPTDSLDREIGDGTHLGELVATLHLAPTPEEMLHPKYSRQRVEELLARAGLTEREADVMRRRSGLVGGERQTLEEIGEEYGVSRERIRQLETRARDRLKVVLAGGAPEPRGKKRRRKPREEAREAEPQQTDRTAVPEVPSHPEPEREPKPEPKPKASQAAASKSGVPEGQGTLF